MLQENISQKNINLIIQDNADYLSEYIEKVSNNSSIDIYHRISLLNKIKPAINTTLSVIRDNSYFSGETLGSISWCKATLDVSLEILGKLTRLKNKVGLSFDAQS